MGFDESQCISIEGFLNSLLTSVIIWDLRACLLTLAKHHCLPCFSVRLLPRCLWVDPTSSSSTILVYPSIQQTAPFDFLPPNCVSSEGPQNLPWQKWTGFPLRIRFSQDLRMGGRRQWNYRVSNSRGKCFTLMGLKRNILVVLTFSLWLYEEGKQIRVHWAVMVFPSGLWPRLLLETWGLETTFSHFTTCKLFNCFVLQTREGERKTSGP